MKLRTSISLGLRSIPPSAGLDRKLHQRITRYVPQRQYLTVVPDVELQKEIAELKGVKK